MKKILVIDDNENMLALIAYLLKEENYLCYQAINGKQGIALAKEKIPDLIICDIKMPDINGYEVLNQILSDHETRDIPFIFLTGFSSARDIRKGMSIGADDYITKPFAKEDLLKAVEVRLSKRDKLNSHHEIVIQQTKERLTKKLGYNKLTKLPNKHLMPRQYKEILKKRKKDLGIGVLVISIDRYRSFKDALGNDGSSNLLKCIAKRVGPCLRAEDKFFNSGENHFTILASNIKNKRDITVLINRILLKAGEYIHYRKSELNITLSIGCSIDYNSHIKLNKLLDQSETAMFTVQQNGGNDFKFYDEEMTKQAFDRLKLENDLTHAKKNNEFRLLYQPQVEMRTGEIGGLEALLRWVHPQLGVVSPLHFIPIAEECGQIIDIGKWVLQKTSNDFSRWISNGRVSPRVAVNVSGEQLKTGNFYDVVKQTLEEYQLSPNNLEIEITESIFMSDLDTSLGQLKKIKDLGVTIAIDDFGSGYSSLSYLKNLPIDTLKIDRSFVKDINRDFSARTIISTIIQMAHSLKLKIIAEGVETKKQYQILRDLGVHYYQGYYFSRPLPEKELIKFINNMKKGVNDEKSINCR